MATLKDAIAIAKQEPNSTRSQQLAEAILSGKMDSIANRERIDLTGFKKAHSVPVSGEQQASRIAELTRISPEIATAGVQKGIADLTAGPIIKKKLIEGVSPITRNLEASSEEAFEKMQDKDQNFLQRIGAGMRGEAGQGLATFLEGVRKLGKTVTGQEDVSIPGKTVKDEMIRSGMSEKEIEFAKNFYGFDLDAPATEPLWKPLLKGAGDVAGGAIQTLGAPITGVIGADVPVVSPITEAAATIGTAPAWIPTKIIANVIDAAARQGGANVESEEYKESVRKPIENILNVFYGRKIPEIAEVVREGTGKIRSFAGKRLKEAGVSVGETVLPTTAKEAELMQKFEAGQLPFKPRTVGETAIERGVTGTQTKIGTKAVKTGVEIFEKEVNPALEASKEIITKKELFSPLEEKVAKTVEPGRKAELSDALEAIKEEYASPEFDNIGLPKAQKIKSGLDEFTPQKSFRGKEIGSAYNQLRNDMADVIRRLTYDKLKDINIKNKYIDYSNLKELEKLGIKARTQKGGAFKPGGTGTLIRDLWDMVTIPAGTIGGRLLYKVGEFLELQSNKPVKTVGEYIKSQGVSKKEFEQQLKPPPVFKTGEIP